MKPPNRLLTAICGWMLLLLPVSARDYQFDGRMPEGVLRSYLSRSMTTIVRIGDPVHPVDAGGVARTWTIRSSVYGASFLSGFLIPDRSNPPDQLAIIPQPNRQIG